MITRRLCAHIWTKKNFIVSRFTTWMGILSGNMRELSSAPSGSAKDWRGVDLQAGCAGAGLTNGRANPNSVLHFSGSEHRTQSRKRNYRSSTGRVWQHFVANPFYLSLEREVGIKRRNAGHVQARGEAIC